MPIYFYSTRDAYGCFSNFSAHGVELKGTWWPTSEHFFQAQKFAGTPHEELVQRANLAMASGLVVHRSEQVAAAKRDHQGQPLRQCQQAALAELGMD